MSAPSDPRSLRLRAAWLAHGYGLTQAQIAERLGVSRATINKALEQARALGEIRVWIDQPEGDLTALALAVEQELGIPEVVVVPSLPDTPPETAIGLALGRLLSDRITPGTRIGLGWGRTLTRALDAFQPPLRPDALVLSLLGGQVRSGRPNPGALAARMAAALGCEVVFLPAPLIVDHPDTRARLISGCGLQALFDLAEQLDIAVFGAGDLGASLALSRLSRAEAEDFERAGAVGEILAQIVDAQGESDGFEVNSRVMAVGLEQIAQASARVLACGGSARAPVIRAAHHRVRLTTLVTDETAARVLAGLPSKES
ncbi:MAG: helix-turn-helix domain-containing protein [Natronohydrobacter sp.]|nr:helix-turn-helix domain-containing protein [Natronohydrobacter sp.]